jgi:hypothetical protein
MYVCMPPCVCLHVYASCLTSCSVLAQVLDPEPEFKEAAGDYIQLGSRGGSGRQLHSITPTHTFSPQQGLRLADPGAAGPCCMWLHQNSDLVLHHYATLMVFLLSLHVQGQAFAQEACEDLDFGAEPCSLFHWAAVALGMDPSTVHCPLAHLVRAPNSLMTAHLDPDLRYRRVMNYYMRSIPPSLGEVRGARLFTGSTQLGGEVVETPTDTHDNHTCLMVAFDPSSQLHWVDTDPAAELEDPNFMRELCFNNIWLASTLCSPEPTLVRMAPLKPCERSPVRCSMCGAVSPSPSQQPSAWLDHFAAAIQCAANCDVRCLKCCQ